MCGRPLTRGGSSSSLSAFTTAGTSRRCPFKLRDVRLDKVKSSLKAQASLRTSSGNARIDPKINWTSRARPPAGKELVRAGGRSVPRRRPISQVDTSFSKNKRSLAGERRPHRLTGFYAGSGGEALHILGSPEAVHRRERTVLPLCQRSPSCAQTRNSNLTD